MLQGEGPGGGACALAEEGVEQSGGLVARVTEGLSAKRLLGRTVVKTHGSSACRVVCVQVPLPIVGRAAFVQPYFRSGRLPRHTGHFLPAVGPVRESMLIATRLGYPKHRINEPP